MENQAKLIDDCKTIVANMNSGNWDDFLNLYRAGLQKFSDDPELKEVASLLEKMCDDKIDDEVFLKVHLGILDLINDNLGKPELKEICDKIIATKVV